MMSHISFNCEWYYYISLDHSTPIFSLLSFSKYGNLMRIGAVIKTALLFSCLRVVFGEERDNLNTQ
ncbi:MAG: hypothetical protein ABI683_05970 [Ginsengibacter sp.]